MSLLCVGILFIALAKKIKKYSSKLKFLIFFFLIIYVIGLLAYTNFLIQKGYQYGIPGADMKEHFDAALYISKGYKWSELFDLTGASRFRVSIDTFSYYVYSLIISILLFFPKIINTQISLYLVYFAQILLAILSIINFVEFFSKKYSNVKKEYIILMCFSFIPFAIQSYQLMRDIILMYFISCFLAVLDSENNKKKYIALAVLVAICFFLRTYSVIITIPVLVYYSTSKKAGIFMVIAISCAFCFALPLLKFFASFTNVSWQLQKANFKEVIQFILFPNVINQFKYLLNWNLYFKNETYMSGCNVPGIYFICSLWNAIIYILCALNVFKINKKRAFDISFWGIILINISILYSINYDAIDTRHRLMMFPSWMIISLCGLQAIQKKCLSREKGQRVKSTKRIMFITTRTFWPTNSGRKVSLYNYCKGLHEKYGYDIYIYTFLEDYSNPNVEDKPDFIKEVRIAKKVGKFTVIKNLLFKSVLTNWPFQNSLMYSKKNEKLIQEYVHEIQPEIIMVDMIRLAPYYNAFKMYDCNKILDMDDLLSKRYESQLNVKKQKGNIMGAFSKQNSLFNKILKNDFIKKNILKIEKRKVFKAEIKYGNMYDKVIFVSDKETRIYNSRVKIQNGCTTRLGVDYNYLSEKINVSKKEGYIGFLGNLEYGPNLDSLELLINEILPKLEYDYHLCIVGKATDEIINKYSSDKIEFKGTVNDFRVDLGQCECFVAPITFGSGVKTKILEAMAMGIPVVTNKLGIEGIDASNDKEIFVRDSTLDMARILNDIYKNDSLRKNIALNAQKLIKEKYDWNIIFDSFKDFLRGDN